MVQAGVITQTIYGFTFVSDVSKKVTVGVWSFLFRQLADQYLNNPAGIINQSGNLVATPERAAADLLYFQPNYHFDVPENLDWRKIKLIQNEIGYYAKS